MKWFFLCVWHHWSQMWWNDRIATWLIVSSSCWPASVHLSLVFLPASTSSGQSHTDPSLDMFHLFDSKVDMGEYNTDHTVCMWVQLTTVCMWIQHCACEYNSDHCLHVTNAGHLLSNFFLSSDIPGELLDLDQLMSADSEFYYFIIHITCLYRS